MKPKVLGGASDDGSPLKHLAPMESNVFTSLHALVAHCAVVRYDDGKPRKPGWITIKTNGAAWIVQVKDPDSCLSMSCTSDTLDNALAMAELLVAADNAPWEKDQFLANQARKVNK